MLIAITACQDGFKDPDNGIVVIRGKEYELIWSDEFEYTGLPDSTKWGYETGYVRNNETQYYTDARIENCSVANGKLHITARNDTFEGHPVTSASIETLNKHQFKYGLIEVRAKMPHLGKGTWPAIWLMGVNRSEVGWPKCGEIDIVEWTGKAPTVVLGSTFLPDAAGTGMTFRSWPYIVSSPSVVTDAFHNYAIEWDSTQIRYYFDDINYTTYKQSDLGVSWEPLKKFHYLKINLAMGGLIPPIGGGGPIDYSRFPYTFEVEYARYYKRVE